MASETAITRLERDIARIETALLPTTDPDTDEQLFLLNASGISLCAA
jgi:hypothetical protein